MGSSARVPGHALMNEGGAYDEWGHRIGPLRERGSLGGYGHGQCSCGELSQPLPSGRARKRWHHQHKEEVKARGEQRRRIHQVSCSLISGPPGSESYEEAERIAMSLAKHARRKGFDVMHESVDDAERGTPTSKALAGLGTAVTPEEWLEEATYG